MNKQEVQEIKRQFKADNDKLRIITIGEAYGLSNGENRKILYSGIKDFSLLDNDEAELYLNILKKSLSGTFGKNLLEFEFEAAGENSMRKRLYDLKSKDALEPEEVESLAAAVLEQGDYRNSVLITIALCEYSAPNLNANKEELEGNSFYRFLVISVSNAKLTEIGLYYNRAENQVMRKVNDEMQILNKPCDALLYPAFSQRASDVNHILYSFQNASKPNIALIEDFLQIPFDTSASEQSEGFAKVISAAFEERLQPETAIALHKEISELIEQQSEEEGCISLEKKQIGDLLENAGADQKSLERFHEVYTEVMEDAPVYANNLTEKGKVSIKTPSISLVIKDDGLDCFSTTVENGKRIIRLEIDDEMLLSDLPVFIRENKS
jgi:hypothetical protein